MPAQSARRAGRIAAPARCCPAPDRARRARPAFRQFSRSAGVNAGACARGGGGAGMALLLHRGGRRWRGGRGLRLDHQRYPRLGKQFAILIDQADEKLRLARYGCGKVQPEARKPVERDRPGARCDRMPFRKGCRRRQAPEPKKAVSRDRLGRRDANLQGHLAGGFGDDGREHRDARRLCATGLSQLQPKRAPRLPLACPPATTRLSRCRRPRRPGLHAMSCRHWLRMSAYFGVLTPSALP